MTPECYFEFKPERLASIESAELAWGKQTESFFPYLNLKVFYIV
jgi:hypothetical protein